MRLRTAITVLLAVFLGACSGDYTLRVRNETGRDLVPYPVVTTPPPPHREADPANTLPMGQTAEEDPSGFNPLYFSPARKIGVLIQLQLDLSPPQVLVRAYEHTLEPGAVGDQLTFIGEELFEPQMKGLTIVIGDGPEGFPITLEEN